MEKTEYELLKEANELIRTLFSVIERSGEVTNWNALKSKVYNTLVEQQKYLYPTIKQLRLRKLNKING